MPTASSPNLPPSTATLMIVLGAICFGMSPFFAKNLVDAGMASVAIAFFRYLASAIILIPFLKLSTEKRRATGWALAAGLSLGLGWIGYVEALDTVAVSTVGVVYMSYPLFTLVIAWGIAGQRPAMRSLGAACLILVSAAITVLPALAVPAQLGALLLSFMAPLAFGFAVCVIATKLEGLEVLERTSGIMLGATLGLLPLIGMFEPSTVFPGDMADWGQILGISIIAALIPNLLFALGAQVVGSARTAMAGSFELPTMFIVGWLAFGEEIGWKTMLAGLLVIAAITITPTVQVNRND